MSSEPCLDVRDADGLMGHDRAPERGPQVRARAPRANDPRAPRRHPQRGGNAASSRSRRCLRVSVSTAEENVATSSTRMATVEENKGVVYPSNLRCALQVNVPTPEVDDAAYSLSNYMRLLSISTSGSSCPWARR